MPTTILDGETYPAALARRMGEEAAFDQTEDPYTREPWGINNWTQPDTSIAIGANGTPLIARVILRDVSIVGQKANARRIVACVNACAGIATRTLEVADETLNEMFKRNCAEYQARCNELLEALKAARRLIELAVPFEGDVTRQIDKAIANEEGGAV